MSRMRSNTNPTKPLFFSLCCFAKMVRMSMIFVAFFVLLGGVGLSKAEVFTVGDKIGWTTQGKIDYAAWAAKYTFHVGDTLLFKYNSTYHNVMEVSKEAFSACSANSPLKLLKTGNDSIPITTAGHHYFLCGVPGHCGLGQKVDVNVLAASSAAPSTSPSVSPSAQTPAPAASTPSPGGSTGANGTGMAPAPEEDKSGASKGFAPVLLALAFAVASASLISVSF